MLTYRISTVVRRCCFIAAIVLACVATGIAQPRIAYLHPDAAAPGMTVAIEVVAPVADVGAFGPDGIAPPSVRLEHVNPSDSLRLIIGPAVISWHGRLMQVPVIVRPGTFGPIPLRVRRGSEVSNADTFFVVQPANPIAVSGPIVFGQGSEGRLSKRNTLVVSSVDVFGQPGEPVLVEFDRTDPDPLASGNSRLLPVTLLSVGPVRFRNATIDVSARSIHGGPGGGGGGHGFRGTGGEGFSGGGASTDTDQDSTNIGSGADPTQMFGGAALSGVLGGESNLSDQGGGGGTGHPFGRSGRSGDDQSPSASGGYGAGSAGGESAGGDSAYGGGGAGHAFGGESSLGRGRNGGNVTGSRVLIPLAGGSGGGAGNALNEITAAGSGGGGGGALTIIAFDSLILENVTVLSTGAAGTNGANLTGGGGGGSGGSVVLGSSKGTRTTRVTIDASGGAGGKGGANATNGGAGSVGRARFDGYHLPQDTAVLAQKVSAPSVDRVTATVVGASVELTGAAAETGVLSDSVRVYYRGARSGWKFIGVKTIQEAGRVKWRAVIPTDRSSALYVVGYQKVQAPLTDSFQHDPSWIATHISATQITTVARPYIASVDTVRFGLVKSSGCKDVSVMLYNLGEASAHIDSVVVPPPFEALNIPSRLEGYDSSTITVRYCPQVAKCDTAIMRVYYGDSVRSIVLLGCGQDRDERFTYDPSPVLFRPTYVGDCDTVQVTIRSTGSDTLHISDTLIEKPPFSLRILGAPVAIAPGKESTITAIFCPTDSGLVNAHIGFAGLEDSLVIRGLGLRRILELPDTVKRGTVCLSDPGEADITIVNRGNDIVTIDSMRLGSNFVAAGFALPQSLTAQTSRTLSFSLKPSGAGAFDTWVYFYEDGRLLDSVLIEYVGVRRSVAVSIEPFFACADQTDQGTLTIRNTGSAEVSVTIDAPNTPFQLLNGAVQAIPPGGEGSALLQFSPAGVVQSFTVPLSVRVSDPVCGDSLFVVELLGVSTEQEPAVSKDTIDFALVPMDSCRVDSITIANVCGPQTTLDPRSIVGDSGFELVSPTTPFTLSTGERQVIRYRYCGTGEDVSRADHEFVLTPLDTIRIVLRARSKKDIVSVAHFRFTSASIETGSRTHSYLVLDSISGPQGVESIQLTVQFDPYVAALESVELRASVRDKGWTLDSRVITPSSAELTFSGPSIGSFDTLLDLQWLGLFGPTGQTTISGTARSSKAGSGSVESGSLSVENCLEQNQPIVSITGGLRPQPVSELMTLEVHTTRSVQAEIEVLNILGHRVLTLSDPLGPGRASIYIPVTGLPEGTYFLRVSAAGYRHTLPFTISR